MKDLEKRIQPIIRQATKEYMGINIPEIDQSIINKLEEPLINIIIDFDLNYKISKKKFKGEFITKSINSNLGNISEVAKDLGLDRRSIHRAINEFSININIAREKKMEKKFYEKEALNTAFKDVLEDYKQVINPERIENFYSKVDEISDDIIPQLKTVTWNEAKDYFDKEYIKHHLNINNHNILKTSKIIKLRYETLLRKIKKLNL